MNPIEYKAFFTREGGRWVLTVELPPWLSLDLLTELQGHALIDMNDVINPAVNNAIKFIQMPLIGAEVKCTECGALNQTAQIAKEVPARKNSHTIKEKIWQLLNLT